MSAGRVTVAPKEFHLVVFDADRIAALAEEVAQRIGLPEDTRIEIEIDESSPLGRVALESLDPIRLVVDSGAFEHRKRVRHMEDDSVRYAMGLWLFRARDRLDPDFGEPPPEDELTLAQMAAWNTYSLGRFERLGFAVSKPRRQYHFRVRHGFNDVSDVVFERLWSAEHLTWADLEEACGETARSRPEGAETTGPRRAATRGRARR